MTFTVRDRMENTVVAYKCTKLEIKFSFELTYVVFLSFLIILQCFRRPSSGLGLFSEQGGFSPEEALLWVKTHPAQKKPQTGTGTPTTL